MPDKPKQKQYKFTLSIRDKHSREVKKIVDFLVGKGILSQTVRDALRLLNDLRRGNTKVLLELFPDILDKLCPPSDNDDIADLKRIVADLSNQVAKQQTVYVPSNATIPPPPPGYPAMKPSKNTLGDGHTFTLPLVDDDDLPPETMKLTPLTGAANGSTLMAGMFGLGD